jgi:hypothetical protein
VGGKQTRRGKHVYVCVAVLILANLTGCALQAVQKQQDEARPNITEAETPPEAGTYEGVKEEKEKEGVSVADKKPSADEVLLSMALTYADSSNPARDYAKSGQYLRRLVKEYPASPLAGQAKILIGLLQEAEQLRRTIDKLNAIMEESRKVDVEIEQKRRERQR